MVQPRFRLTEKILHTCSEIARLLGRYEGIGGPKPQPKLRRRNRIKTIQGSLAIEGNVLTVEQITALLDGKRVLGPRRDLLEVQNANAAYDEAKRFDAYSVQSVLRAHQIMMNGIIPDAGK